MSPSKLNNYILILLVVISAPVLAEEETLDISTRLGGMFGFAQAPDLSNNKPFEVGGATAALAFNKEISNSYETYFELQAVVDAESQSVLKQGASIGWGYHLIGGSAKGITDVPGGQVVEQNSHALTFLLRSGFFSYSARARQAGGLNLKGQLVEVMGGLQYRTNFWDNDFGIQAMVSVVSFPTSVEEMRTDLTEVNAYWRLIL